MADDIYLVSIVLTVRAESAKDAESVARSIMGAVQDDERPVMDWKVPKHAIEKAS